MPNQSKTVQPIVSASSRDVNQNTKRLCELFEYPQNKLSQTLRDEAPAGKEALEERDHRRRSAF